MGELNSKSLEPQGEKQEPAVAPVYGNHDELVPIVFKKDAQKIYGRKPGVRYRVDPSLAHHFCVVLEAADYVNKKDRPRPPKAGQANDRAMGAPPRGQGGGRRED